MLRQVYVRSLSGPLGAPKVCILRGTSLKNRILGVLGRILRAIFHIMGHLPSILTPSWGILGHLGAILGYLGPSWGHLGFILAVSGGSEPSEPLISLGFSVILRFRLHRFNFDYLAPGWAISASSWPVLGPLGTILGSSWAFWGPSWALLGPSWGHLGAILEPSWPASQGKLK